MSELIMEVLGVPASRVAVVCGPNLAQEIAERRFATRVVARADESAAHAAAALLSRSAKPEWYGA